MTFNGVIVDSRPIPPNHCLRWQGCVLLSSPRLRDALWVFSWQRCPCFQLLLSRSGGKNVVWSFTGGCVTFTWTVFDEFNSRADAEAAAASLWRRGRFHRPPVVTGGNLTYDLNSASLHLLVKAQWTIKQRNSLLWAFIEPHKAEVPGPGREISRRCETCYLLGSAV